MIPTRCTI